MYVTNIWGCAFFFGGIGACFGALVVLTLFAAFAHREQKKKQKFSNRDRGLPSSKIL